MAYHEPRPYMYDSALEPYGCSAEYGNPSGHSLFAAAFNFFFFLDLFHGDHLKRRSNLPLYVFAAFLTFSLTTLIAYARLYVMVHTINQIIYGVQLGLWLAFYFHYGLRTYILTHIENITVDYKDPQLRYSRYILISSVIAILAFGSQIITYFIVDATFTPPQLWIDNIAVKCGKDVEHDKDILNYKSVVLSGTCVATYGSYLGILLHRKYFGQIWIDIYRTSVIKFFLRYLVIIVLCFPLACPFLFIPWSAPLGVLLIFKVLVPSTSAGFVAYAFTHYFYDKFKLYNDKSNSLYSPKRSTLL